MMKLWAMAVAALVVAVAPSIGVADDAAVMELVNRAVAVWQEKGENGTLRAVNSPTGQLRNGSLYVFACDFTGQMLAHSVQESLRNRDTWEMQDANGKFMVQEFIKQAKSPEGFGFVEYDWLPARATEPIRKRTFVRRIPGQDILVGCGYHAR
jgi:cytochrome c